VFIRAHAVRNLPSADTNGAFRNPSPARVVVLEAKINSVRQVRAVVKILDDQVGRPAKVISWSVAR
jgi:hypothetical protein